MSTARAQNLAFSFEAMVERGRESAIERCARLAPKEIEVLRQVACGLGDAQIGRRLGLCTQTVMHYTQRIRQKAGVTGRVNMARLAHRAGLVSLWSDPEPMPGERGPLPLGLHRSPL